MPRRLARPSQGPRPLHLTSLPSGSPYSQPRLSIPQSSLATVFCALPSVFSNFFLCVRDRSSEFPGAPLFWSVLFRFSTQVGGGTENCNPTSHQLCVTSCLCSPTCFEWCCALIQCKLGTLCELAQWNRWSECYRSPGALKSLKEEKYLALNPSLKFWSCLLRFQTAY